MAAPRNDNVKKLILETAEGLLNERGMDHVSLAAIAAECGISKGTLYYHYRSKEDILMDLVDRYLAEQMEDLDRWINDSSKDTSLNRILKYVIERNFHDAGSRFHLLYQACIGNEELRQKLLTRYQKYLELIADTIAKHDPALGEEAARYISWLAILLTDGMIVQAELGNEAFDPDGFIRQTEQFFKLIFREQDL